MVIPENHDVMTVLRLITDVNDIESKINGIIIPCLCTYNTETKVHNLTRKKPDQPLDPNETLIAVFTPDADFIEGDKFAFENEICRCVYNASDQEITNGAFTAQVSTMVLLQPMPA